MPKLISPNTLGEYEPGSRALRKWFEQKEQEIQAREIARDNTIVTSALGAAADLTVEEAYKEAAQRSQSIAACIVNLRTALQSALKTKSNDAVIKALNERADAARNYFQQILSGYVEPDMLTQLISGLLMQIPNALKLANLEIPTASTLLNQLVALEKDLQGIQAAAKNIGITISGCYTLPEPQPPQTNLDKALDKTGRILTYAGIIAITGLAVYFGGTALVAYTERKK